MITSAIIISTPAIVTVDYDFYVANFLQASTAYCNCDSTNAQQTITNSVQFIQIQETKQPWSKGESSTS